MNLAFFDVDQTILEGFSGSDICIHFEKIGVFPRGFAEWDGKMVAKYKRGEISYHDLAHQILSRLTSYFQGKTTEEVANLMEQYAGLITHKIFPWVHPVVDALKNKDFSIALVSGSTEPFIRIIAKHLGARYVAASTPEIKSGIYTGVLARFLNGEEKVHAIKDVVSQENPRITFGFGDSTGDIAMLERVTYGFWHEPDQEEVKAMAQNRERWFLATRDTMESIVKNVLKNLPEI